MEKYSYKKLMMNTVLAFAMSFFFIGVIVAYGRYQLCIKGTSTGGGCSIGLIAFLLVIAACLPLAGIPLLGRKRNEIEYKEFGFWLVTKISMASGILVLVAIVFCKCIFETSLYEGGEQLAQDNSENYFWKMLLLPCVLAFIQLSISLYQGVKLEKNRPNIGNAVILQLGMNRRDVEYLAVIELGLLVLTIIFYSLSLSDVGDCIIFRGSKPYGVYTDGTMIYIVAGVLEDVSEIMLFVTPIATFILLKKELQDRIMKIAPRVCALVSAGLLAIMLYYIMFYDNYLYNGNYELLESNSGQMVTLLELFAVPLIISAMLLILSLKRIMDQRKEIGKTS
jgi:hypothetical protein